MGTHALARDKPWLASWPGHLFPALAHHGLNRPATLDLAISLVLGCAALALSLSHPNSHAFIGESQNGDAAYWDLNAESWARGYVATKVPDIRTGYSVFLGIVYVLTGPDFWHAFVAQALLYAAAVVGLFWLGKQIGGRLVGLLAAAQLALDPYMWEWTAITTTELLGSVANLGALVCLVLAVRRGNRVGSAALFGVLLAVANIVRSLTLAFVVPAILLVAAAPAGRKQRIARCLAAIAATILTLLPAALYQQFAAGDAGLSSNSASNLFAASSPKFGAWTPDIEIDVAADLQRRGVPVTSKSLEAEFTRLTVQNYVHYPMFQVSRIVAGSIRFAVFDGESDQPGQYTFYRPGVVGVLLLAAGALALLSGARRRIWRLLPLLAITYGLVQFATQTLNLLELVGVILSVGGLVARPRSPRVLAAVAVAAFWASTGLSAIVTTNVAGFFLTRLYTQVEPARCLLVALGAAYLSFGLMRASTARGRLFDLAILVYRVRPAPSLVRAALIACGVSVALVVVLGTTRLAMVNIDPPPAGAPFVMPTDAELLQISERIGLPGPLRYVRRAQFPETLQQLSANTLPNDPTPYAIPGQFSRFLWYMSDEDRTLYWFVFSDTPRPASLDQSQMLVESLGRLPLSTYRDRLGLLIVVPTAAYFQQTGDWNQIIPLTTRAFVPWDSASHHFQLDQAAVFPLDVPLYDHQRFLAARKLGEVSEVGSIRVATGDRYLPALGFRLVNNGSTERVAELSFEDVWIPPGAHAHFWVSLDPRIDWTKMRAQRVEVRSGSNSSELLSAVDIDPAQTAPGFAPVDVDLSRYGGQRAEITLRVVGPADGNPSEILVGDPRLIMPISS